MEKEEQEKVIIKDKLREGIETNPSEIENVKMRESLPKFQIEESQGTNEILVEDQYDEPSLEPSIQDESVRQSVDRRDLPTEKSVDQSLLNLNIVNHEHSSMLAPINSDLLVRQSLDTNYNQDLNVVEETQ